MKTCVINVYQRSFKGKKYQRLGEVCKSNAEADIAAIGRGFRDNPEIAMYSIGRALRSAGVAYRLRVTMKDKR